MRKLKEFNISFKDNKSKRAHKAACFAIELLGGVSEAAKVIGCGQPHLTSIVRGRSESKNGKSINAQRFFSPEMAIKLSIATDYQVSAQELVPHHDFSYMFEYVDGIQ